MKILFLDTECNSLDTDRGFVQELAWAVYDADSKRLLKASSSILRWNMQYEVEPMAYQTTGLSREFCENTGIRVQDVFGEFLVDVQTVDAVAGHNVIEYDLKMLASNIRRSLFSTPFTLLDKFVLDTMWDCPYKNPRQIMALRYLAYDHGYILSNAHQAMADVFASAHVFFSYPLKECIEIAKTPLMNLHGYTDYNDEPGREAFYRSKFRWDKPKKRWERKARAFYIPGTQLELGRDMFTEIDGKEMIIKYQEKSL